MLTALPETAQAFASWGWEDIKPHFDALAERPLDAATIDGWLADWTRLWRLIGETYSRLYVAHTLDTADKALEARYHAYIDSVITPSRAADNRLRARLLDSGLAVDNFDIALRNIRAHVELFRPENLPLLAEDEKLGSEYARIIGAQTVVWDGEEKTVPQLRPLYQHPEREVRERAWRLVAERQLADREAINANWVKLLTLRRQIAANAGLPDYRAYRWRDLLRFDYTPKDCLDFHHAIEQVVVPAAERLYERRRRRLNVETLRPWDVSAEPAGVEPLRPFKAADELETVTGTMFERLDPQFGGYFDVMRREGLLDLENRKGKAPGGYCTTFELAGRPFIFMNAVGLHDDVQTLLHEGGHAFHTFEVAGLPYYQQQEVPIEFAEVASMSMELLAAPYLTRANGGFYDEAEAARARVEHLEGIITFWPYMAVVDAFQHWAYLYPEDAANPANCDVYWAELWGRFMKGVDWSGLDDVMMTGWHRKLHIHQIPFYYIEYGLAQLGAVQVWRNSLGDMAGAVAAYRRALGLGGMVSLPDLFAAAGARFALDSDLLGECVALVETTINQLDPA